MLRKSTPALLTKNSHKRQFISSINRRDLSLFNMKLQKTPMTFDEYLKTKVSDLDFFLQLSLGQKFKKFLSWLNQTLVRGAINKSHILNLRSDLTDFLESGRFRKKVQEVSLTSQKKSLFVIEIPDKARKEESV